MVRSRKKRTSMGSKFRAGGPRVHGLLLQRFDRTPVERGLPRTIDDGGLTTALPRVAAFLPIAEDPAHRAFRSTTRERACAPPQSPRRIGPTDTMPDPSHVRTAEPPVSVSVRLPAMLTPLIYPPDLLKTRSISQSIARQAFCGGTTWFC